MPHYYIEFVRDDLLGSTLAQMYITPSGVSVTLTAHIKKWVRTALSVSL